ncbi:MAG: hypothetical protein WC548_02400 [Candidatus Pacearchaeota archaeon]
MKKSLIDITLSTIISLVVLIILLGLANLVPVNNMYATKVLEFINLHVLIIILFILFFFLGELFFLFGFPLNIPGPVFYAYGGYFLSNFIFEIFYLINDLHPTGIFSQVKYLEPTVNILIIAIILIIGFSKILINKKKKEETRSEDKEVEWKDVGNELKKASHNIVSKFNQLKSQKESEEKTAEKKKSKKKGK